jgi:hypothetical protein
MRICCRITRAHLHPSPARRIDPPTSAAAHDKESHFSAAGAPGGRATPPRLSPLGCSLPPSPSRGIWRAGMGVCAGSCPGRGPTPLALTARADERAAEGAGAGAGWRCEWAMGGRGMRSWEGEGVVSEEAEGGEGLVVRGEVRLVLLLRRQRPARPAPPSPQAHPAMPQAGALVAMHACVEDGRCGEGK